MSEVSWIKLKTDMFDNTKIRLIEKLPEGDTILIIWIKLLATAGKANRDGYIMLSENVGMNYEEIALVFDRPLNTVRLALEAFKRYGMIEVDDDELIRIANWDKHQNIDGLQRVREQNKLRKQRQREKEREEKRKLLELTNPTVPMVEAPKDIPPPNDKEVCHVTITGRHATEKEEEEDKERDKDIKDIPKTRTKTKVKKNQYAEFVTMTEKEYNTLATTHGIEAAQSMITILDNYKGASGKKYASDYRAILSWVIKRYTEDLGKQTNKPTNRHDEFQQLREELLNNDGQATNFINHPINNDILSKPKN